MHEGSSAALRRADNRPGLVCSLTISDMQINCIKSGGRARTWLLCLAGCLSSSQWVACFCKGLTVKRTANEGRWLSEGAELVLLAIQTFISHLFCSHLTIACWMVRPGAFLHLIMYMFCIRVFPVSTRIFSSWLKGGKNGLLTGNHFVD